MVIFTGGVSSEIICDLPRLRLHILLQLRINRHNCTVFNFIPYPAR